MSESKNNTKKSHGGLTFFIVIIVLSVCIFGIVKLIQYQQTKQPVDGQHTTQGNLDGTSHLFRRSANLNDVTISTELDLASFGSKIIIMPKVDISMLEITVNFLDSNKKLLTSTSKQVGNVKKGVQATFSISLFELGFSVAWNTKYNTVAVTGGTVSYFS